MCISRFINIIYYFCFSQSSADYDKEMRKRRGREAENTLAVFSLKNDVNLKYQQFFEASQVKNFD